ncbi:hypothetical protein [Chitinophaga solisilvae]|uniref:hypothetical protein n=1 Tax=Chitinophaga solisilvae TaxID=1233460 RepID=UPI00136833B2|nr:hypothetical protein [Chitinophaga solisilvae]
MKKVFSAAIILLFATAAGAQEQPKEKEKAGQATAAAQPKLCGTPHAAMLAKQDTAMKTLNGKKRCCTQPSRTSAIRAKKTK